MSLLSIPFCRSVQQLPLRFLGSPDRLGRTCEDVLQRRWGDPLLVGPVRRLSGKPYSEVPGPSLFSLMKEGIAEGPDAVHKPFAKYDRWRKEYGDVVGINLLGVKIILSYDHTEWEKILRFAGKYPAPLQLLPFLEREKRKKQENPNYEQMMISLTGDEWKDNRQNMDQKFMVPSQVAKYDNRLEEITTDFTNLLKEKIDDSGKISGLEKLFYAYSTEGIAAVMYDMRVGLLSHNVPKLGEDFLKALEDVFHVASGLALSLPFYLYVSTPAWKEFCKGLDHLENLSKEYIQKAEEYHKNTPSEERLDLLNYLCERGQNRDRVVSNAVTMFFAGADSTSNSSLWLLHNLGRFPRVQEKLREEITQVLGPADNPAPFSAEALRKMPYLRNVVKESLRLTPTGPGLVRIFDEPIEVGGYNIPPGTQIFLNQFTVNKDPIEFPDPYNFIPERWERNQTKYPKPSPWIHLPFGWGPRMCQGMR